MKYCLLFLSVSVLAAAGSGCNQPLSAYEQAQESLVKSRGLLIEGDQALAQGGAERATEVYLQAANDLAWTVPGLESAERDIADKIRALDEEKNRTGSASTVTADQNVKIGSRNVAVSRYYAESLAAYRELRATAVQMRALALGRVGEAQYRSGAQQFIDGDQFYRAKQFAATQGCYNRAEQRFHGALDYFGQAAELLNAKLPAGTPVATSSPDTWRQVQQLRWSVTYRRNQADAYHAAAVQRVALVARVVDAYQARSAGNVPTIDIRPLPPPPVAAAYAVIPPPIPSTEPARAAHPPAVAP